MRVVNHGIPSVCLAIAIALLSAGSVRAEDAAEITVRLHRAEALNRIDDASMTPWHLKLSFQLMDAKGHPAEKGTVEEWWRSPSQYKIVFNSPSYTSTQIQTNGTLYRTKDMASAPYLLELVLDQVVHPLIPEDINDGIPYMRKENFGKVALDCIMITQPIKNVASPPVGLFPTYCFDPDQENLRASYNFGSQFIVRNSIGSFEKHKVTVDQVVKLNNVDAITAHVDELRGAALAESDFSPPNDLVPVNAGAVKVASGVVAGMLLNQPRPVYPESARLNHVSGSVVLGARIGTDGRIHSLKLISIPDPILAIAALAAVRQWTYRPYLLNGLPVQVDTTITVNFNFR
ncbi:MAG: energy transducer TonB [Acidobacteria bacterium]|nr:energy transducer TonB [Acidobacteriota bacterium]